MKMISNGRQAMVATLMMAALASPAFAKTDVNGKIEQLKENSTNSKANLAEYEDGFKTVEQNLAEAQKAQKSLEKQRQALLKQMSDSQKGKTGVDSAKAQVDTYMQAEQQKMTAEQKQIEELKATLATLEANVQKRQANVAAYKEKRAKVDGEMASYNEHNQSIVELDQALRAKINEADADEKRLIAKKASYEEEIAKWKKQIRVSERDYNNYSKLKED